MNIAQALRFLPSPSLLDTSPKSFGFFGGWEGVAFVGAGGKTTALFQLARELPPPVIVTATTHLHVEQIKLADSHWVMESSADLADLKKNLRGVMLVTGPIEGNRTTGLNGHLIDRLRAVCKARALPFLIEADGSRQRPLKAPAEHEPPIPEFVETVVVVTGLSGLGKPLTEEFVHCPEIFARLSDLAIGETITPEILACLLIHPEGGLKNIPAEARRVALLNQADTNELQSQAKSITGKLLSFYSAVIIASLNPSAADQSSPSIAAVHEPVAGIILAAGESKRFGKPKQLLGWHGKPFVRQVAEMALVAGLSPVVVVTGANAQAVEVAVNDLPVKIVRNAEWQKGQSSSIQAGLQALPPSSLRDISPKSKGFGGGREGVRAAIFLLADQPQVTPTVLCALVEQHSAELAPIVAPLVDGQRANPVLFDRITFPDLMALTGDVGGRAIFSKYPVNYLPWHDESLLVDVDTPDDLKRLNS
jgi:molybdenum cofactor cytidylyltransferase